MSDQLNNSSVQMEEIGIDDLLNDAKAPLLKAKDELEGQAEFHQKALNEINEKLKRVTRTLQTIDPPTPARRVKRSSSGGASSGTVAVGEETVQKVLATLRKKGEGTITEIADELGLSTPSVSAAFRELRSREEVRLAGRKGMSQLFKPFTGASTTAKDTESDNDSSADSSLKIEAEGKTPSPSEAVANTN